MVNSGYEHTGVHGQLLSNENATQRDSLREIGTGEAIVYNGSVTRHALVGRSAREHAIDVHLGAKDEVPDAGAEHDGQDQVCLRELR